MADDAKLLEYLKKVSADLYQARHRLREFEQRDQEPRRLKSASASATRSAIP